MSKTTKLALGLGLAVMLLAVVFAGQALAQQATPTPGSMMGDNGGMMAAPTSTPGASGGNMMAPATGLTNTMPFGPYGMMGWRFGVTTTVPFGPYGMMGWPAGVTGTVPYGVYGMMGMMGNGMMGMMGGNGMMDAGMMGMLGGWSDPNAKPLTIEQAQAAAQKYIQGLPNNAGNNLAPTEVMEFTNGFYVVVSDKAAGTGAFELLVDRYTGATYPEPGPDMMWNTKYGMMAGQQGGMMGMMGLWVSPVGTPSVSAQQARANAQKFLDTKFPGTGLADDTLTFPGYFTIDFLKDGNTVGMLSVNAYTGQVWYHTWHGQFLSEREL